MKHLLISALVSISLFGCGKNKKCNQEDTFSGIVVTQLSITGTPDHRIAGVNLSSGFYISNDSVYKSTFKYSSNLPAIDFTQYDLLGNVGNSYCKVSFHKEVIADSVAKKYHYKLFAYYCSTYNQKACFNYNWVLVPKLPQGWEVTYDLIKAKN